MLSTYAKIMGSIFILIGIMGFLPGVTPDHMLLGIFMVNPLHNIVHLLSGIVLLSVGLSENWDLTRRTVLLFALIYGLITILGFFAPENGMVLGLAVNRADNILHLAITVSALLFAVPQRYPTAMR